MAGPEAEGAAVEEAPIKVSSHPARYLVRIAIFLILVGAVGAVLGPQLSGAFLANAPLNGLILGVLLLGILYTLRQILMLRPEVQWLRLIQEESRGGLLYPNVIRSRQAPRLLGPIVNMLSERRGRLSISPIAQRAVIDGIQTRIEEGHDISRYLIGLLIFLGLLGTFWGLLETVEAVGQTIGGLSGTVSDPAAVFDELKRGLQTPLSGMGTAFSSSLFGLAGSLVLGFLELQAAQAHNRFLNDLEEWLSRITRITSGSGGGGGDGDGSVPAYIQALLEQTADSLDSLQRAVARGEEERHQGGRSLQILAERLEMLTEQMRTEQSVLLKIAESQVQLKPLFERLAGQDVGGIDKASREHLRNLDRTLTRLLEDGQAGRAQVIHEIRSEIRLLARTIAAIAEETG